MVISQVPKSTVTPRLCRRGLHDLNDPANYNARKQNCIPCATALRTAWRADHPDRDRATNKRSRDAHPERTLAHIRRWQKRHPGTVRRYSREWMRRWREANPELAREVAKEWREGNRERVNETAARYRERHPDRVAEAQQRYKDGGWWCIRCGARLTDPDNIRCKPCQPFVYMACLNCGLVEHGTEDGVWCRLCKSRTTVGGLRRSDARQRASEAVRAAQGAA